MGSISTQIADITLLEEIGRGHGGVVFNATRAGEPCLVKLPSEPPRPSATEEPPDFVRDALALARTTGTALPRILQVGRDGDLPYVVMERVEATPLDVLLQRGLSPNELMRLSLELCSAFHHLHAEGFIYGRVRPGDVLLHPDSGTVYLLDGGNLTRLQGRGGQGAQALGERARITDNNHLGELLGHCLALVGWPRGRERERSELAKQIRLLSTTDCRELDGSVRALTDLLHPGSRSRSSFPPPRATTAQGLGERQRGARVALRQLEEVLSRAKGQAGAAVTLLGPPGSGKSHLLSQFADQVAADGHLVLEVRCSDTDWTPFSAFKRMLDDHLRGLAGLEPEARDLLVSRLQRAAGPMASMLRTLSPQLEGIFKDSTAAPSELDARRTFIEGAAEFLLRYIDQCGTTLIAVDDLQWLDGSSRRVVAQVAARLSTRGALLVLARRDDDPSEVSEQKLLKLAGEGPLQQIPLEPLLLSEAADIVQSYLGDTGPNPQLVEQLLGVSNGTPLSLIEVLHRALEHGHLSPRWGTWQLDQDALRTLELPADSTNGAARVAELPPHVRRVLGAAAVANRSATVALLAEVLSLSLRAVRDALELARYRRLVSVGEDGSIAFLHDSLREASADTVASGLQPELHHLFAQALENRDDDSPEHVCELARHYAMAGDLAAPARAHEVAMLAARHFLARWDDHNALASLERAATAAQRAGLRLPAGFHLEKAEAHWRTGDGDAALSHFEQALAQSSRRLDRAHILSRIVSVQSYGSASQAVMATLTEAFATLGRDMPSDEAIALPRRMLALALERRKEPHARPPEELEELELLCRLQRLVGRIAVESGQPRRLLASTLEMARISRNLPACAARVTADCVVGFALLRVGQTRLAARYQRWADETAAALNDPAAKATCAGIKHVAAAWTGRYDEARQWAEHYVHEHWQWAEIAEYCHIAFGMYGLESVMGHPREALRWLEILIARASQHPHAPPVGSLVEDALVGTLLTLGREHELPRYRRKLQRVQAPEVEPGGYYHLLSFQGRIQRHAESFELGHQAESVIAEFERIYGNADHAHMLATAYYAHVAQARIDQCLRASHRQRRRLLPKVKAALADTERHKAMPLGRCYTYMLRAHVAFFSGDAKAAEATLTEADRVAREIHCVWVQIASARLRAHMLYAAGKRTAAACQLEQAIALAKRHGHERRAERMRTDLEPEVGRREQLADKTQPLMAPGRKTIRQHLNALLNISRAGSWELGLDRQARLVLVEMVQAVEAQRGYLFLQREDSDALELASAVGDDGADGVGEEDFDLRVVSQVYGTGQPRVIAPKHELGLGEERSALCTPLVLNGEVVGVVYVDRQLPREPFSDDEVELLQALASQVPVTLELARSLNERQTLEQHLQQAQKMEAIGRLAGGIAHDFNNILATIQIAGSTLTERLEPGSDGAEEIKDILDVAERGAALTKQLLTFARRETAPPKALDLNAAIDGMLPMLTRLVGPQVSLERDLMRELPMVLGDKARIDQVLLNLVTNARDALREGGTIRLRTRRLQLDEPKPGAPSLQPGVYVVLSVIDDGTGMTEDVAKKIFDPFFTTKNPHSGTGLGLSTVYGIVKDAGGHIDVHTALGRGTRIDVCLPTSGATDPEPERDGRSGQEQPRGGRETLLVVDDDPYFCRVTQRALTASGYRVLTASDSRQALAYFEREADHIDMVISDVQMPLIDGKALVQALRKRKPELKALWVSGNAAPDLLQQGLLDGGRQFLRKPFAAPVIVRRVREVLDG